MSIWRFFRRDKVKAKSGTPPQTMTVSDGESGAEALLGAAPGSALLLDHEGTIVWANARQCNELGKSLADIRGLRLTDVHCSTAAETLELALARCREGGGSWEGVVACDGVGRLRHLGTSIHPVSWCAARWMLMKHDVSRLQLQAASAQRLSRTIESRMARLPGVVFRLRQSPGGGLSFDYLGPGFESQTGLSRQSALEDVEVVLSRLDEDAREQFMLALAQSLVSLTPWHLDITLGDAQETVAEGQRWFEARGTPQRFDDGTVVWDGLLLDVTQRKQAESRVAKLVSTDVLTGVMNRRAFLEAGARVLARLRRRGEPAVLAMLDLDHFKSLNDAYGHAAGDMVLKAFADTCRLSLRPYDLLARIGGEEFLVLLGDVHAEDAWDILERLRSNVEASTLKVDRRALKVTVSMGAICVGQDESLDMAMRRVDGALYDAKRAGRNQLKGLLPEYERDNLALGKALASSTIYKEIEMALSEDLRIPKPCPNCGSYNMRVPSTKNPDEKVHCASCQTYVCLYSEAAEMIEKTPKSESEELIEKAMNRDK